VALALHIAKAGLCDRLIYGIVLTTCRVHFSLINRRMVHMPRKCLLEKRLEAGALLIKTFTGDPSDPVKWSFSNSKGRVRSADVDRLCEEGRIFPMNDGLFDDSQTYGLSK
jgi:hypothetical protein